MNANQPTLSPTVQAELDVLIERIARKSGYAGQTSMQQHIQAKVEAKMDKARAQLAKTQVRLGGTPKTDFAEEIRTYLADGIADLIAEGHSEAEALQITRQKFDDAELAPNFDAFLDRFDSFGLNHAWNLSLQSARESREWYAQHGEVVGLFYGGFVILGLVAGSLLGYLTGDHAWSAVGIGAAAGLGFGIAAGLLANAIVRARN
ncbi:MAG: permease prefix domain 1-containing protein [Bifidobacteriaceae bacterium]|jgi:ElaB/YqjD/DUF883 family membrane-anchored ribosome-binding protein|nr:permease prefix domain 1-containing protein [Bifidobacteriaceae bacterium]